MTMSLNTHRKEGAPARRAHGATIWTPDRRLMLGALGGLLATGCARDASNFPARPLKIMSPSNPGGGTDQLARVLRLVVAEERLSPRPIEVINRGGAGGVIGLAEFVSQHHGDPYTVLAAGGALMTAPLVQNSPFRATAAYPLARLTVDPLVVAVPFNSPHATLQELVATFRRDPAAVTWCGGGAGSLDHLLALLISDACGVPPASLRYIAYSGGGTSAAALMGGQVTAGSADYTEFRQLGIDGRLRILGSASEQRVSAEIPTLREAGLDVLLQNWRGVFTAQGLEPEHLQWWANLVDRVRASGLWQELRTRNHWQDAYLTGEQFRQTIAREDATYSRMLRQIGIGQGRSNEAMFGAYAAPMVIGAAAAVAIGATVVEQLRSGGRAVAPAAAEDGDDGAVELPVWGRFFAGAALTLAYVAALATLGFLIATPVLMLALCLLMGSNRPARDLIAGVAVTLAVWLLFTRLLSVDLP